MRFDPLNNKKAAASVEAAFREQAMSTSTSAGNVSQLDTDAMAEASMRKRSARQQLCPLCRWGKSKIDDSWWCVNPRCEAGKAFVMVRKVLSGTEDLAAQSARRALVAGFLGGVVVGFAFAIAAWWVLL